MNIDRERSQLPPSPSLSTASTTSSAQAPFTTKTLLLRRAIPSEKVDELISRYNRRNIPIMDDELFLQKLDRIANDHPADEVEPALQHLVAQECARLSDDFLEARSKIGMPGLELFSSDSNKFHFTTGLRKHTVHGYEGIVAYCIPSLIEECRKSKLKRKPRASTSRRNNGKSLSKAEKPSLRTSAAEIAPRSVRASPDPPRRRSRRLNGQEPSGIFK
jgi:hypothetical protein